MNEIGVVHLVRAQNGIGPLKNFLESYKLNPGAIEHDLIILFKGFHGDGPSQEYRLLLRPFKYKELHVSDQGFDITAYFAASSAFQYKYYCFLNSFSIILDAEWLAKLYHYASQEHVGLVGATGSYQSFLQEENPWALLKKESAQRTKYPWLRKYWFGRLDRPLRYMLRRWRLKRHFRTFPNFHIRSNAFMLRSDVMKKIVCRKIKNKMDAYKCESGNQSITIQVENLGKSILIVGKDGSAYEKSNWWRSNTFWRDGQENLLISDNQTRMYSGADLETKIYYSNCAWGSASSPKSKIF